MTTPVLRGSTAPLPGRPDGTPFGQNTLQATSPDSTLVGDLVLLVSWHGTAPATGSVLTLRSGEDWTQLFNFFHDDGSNDGSFAAAWKIATQAGAQVYQAFNTTSPSTDCRTALRIYSVGTFDTSSMPFATPVTFTDGNVSPDPGNISSLVSTRDYLIEAIGGWWHSNGTVNCIPGAPSGYGSLISTTDPGWLELAIANKAVAGVTSENPGVFTDNVDSTNTHGSVSGAIAILGAPGNVRRAIITQGELETPDPAPPRRAIVTQAELEVPNKKFPETLTYIFNRSWNRYKFQSIDPQPVTPRRAIITQAELETPDLTRRAIVSHGELEVPETGGVGIGVDWGGGGNVDTQEAPYTTWLGRQPDLFVGWIIPWAPGGIGINGNWTFITSPNTVSGTLDNLGNFLLTRPNRRAELTISPMPWVGAGGSSRGFYWGEIAAGLHDSKFTACANALKNTYHLGGSTNQPVYIRLAWEMELNFSHGVGTDAAKMANFGPGWRRIVDVMRAVNPNFKFFFCPSIYTYRLSQWGLPWINAIYPGNDHVDIIGSDFYDAGGSYPPSTLANQTSMWNNYHVANLQVQDDFANSKGKPQAFGEWGVWHSSTGTDVGGNDNPLFIENTIAWIQNHNFVYAKYFEDNNSTAHSELMNSTEFPNASLKYRQLVAPLSHPW